VTKFLQKLPLCMKRNPRRDLVLVKDVLKAIHCVEDFIGDKEFDGFAKDPILMSAVFHQFMIIGEASAKISDEFQETHPEIPFHKIIGMRNTIVHGYSLIDETIVWKAYKNNLPELKEKLLKI